MPKNVCSFCGRSESEVKLLITGIKGYICENCAKQAYDIVCLLGTILADIALDACYQQLHFALTSSAKATYILWHYSSTPFLRVNTASIIPYSLASSAVIQ